MKKLFLFSACSVAFMLTSCGDQPQTVAKKEPAKPAEPASGQTALYKMYQVARSAWALDAQVLTVNSIHLTEIPQVPGKAAAWQAKFTSDKLGRARSYTYSVVESQGNLRKGVFALQEESWSGKQGANTSFLIAAVSTDTEAAYKTALENAGDYAKKNPDMTISLLLEKTPKFPDPAWRVIWGESVGTANLSVYVDASTGKFLEKIH